MQVIHARSGVPHEIMGLMQGKVVGNSIVIMDSFALPVQGTETRVNAANEANEYMVEYIQGSEKVRLNNSPKSSGIWSFSSPRPEDWRTPLDGIILTRGMDVGCLVLMSTPKSPTKNSKTHSLLLWCALLVSAFGCIIEHRYADRPKPHHLCWKGRHRSLPHVSRELHSSQRVLVRIPIYSSQQDRGFRCSCKPVLSSRCWDLQVEFGHGVVGDVVEQVLGEYIKSESIDIGEIY